MAAQPANCHDAIIGWILDDAIRQTSFNALNHSSVSICDRRDSVDKWVRSDVVPHRSQGKNG